MKRPFLCFVEQQLGYPIKVVHSGYLTKLRMEMNQTLVIYSSTLGKLFATFGFAMPRLSPLERGHAIGMLQAAVPVQAIAHHFNCTLATVYALRRRYAITDAVEDRPRSGRPRLTTRRQDRFIPLSHLRDRFRPASRTADVTIGSLGRPICRNQFAVDFDGGGFQRDVLLVVLICPR